MRVVIESIEHKDQRYPTVGDWQFDGDTLRVRVSQMKDDDYEFLVGIHELIEAYLCKKRGVSEAAVDLFDREFEARRPEGNTEEPGDDSDAPYRREHFVATTIERQLAHELWVDWNDYAAAVEAL